MKTLIIDIETDSLDPSVIWVAVTKDVETGEVNVYRRPDLDPVGLIATLRGVDCLVGHNCLGFDLPVLERLVPGFKRTPHVIDTLVVSRLLDFGLDGGHSLEAWGLRLGCKKGDFNDFSALTEEMVEYCIQDVEVTAKLHHRFRNYLKPESRWAAAVRIEHFMAVVCRDIHVNGFHFSIDECKKLKYNIDKELEKLDEEIIEAFPPRPKLLREVHPRATKHGTINRSDFRWVRDGDLTPYSVDAPFSLIEYVEFNPGSVPQIVERLNEAGWKPTEKTKGHLQAERDKNEEKLVKLRVTGWKVSESNLDSLPDYSSLELWLDKCRVKLPQTDESINELITNLTPTESGQQQEHIITNIHDVIGISNLDVITELVSTTLTQCQMPSEVSARFVKETNHSWSIIVTPTGTYVDCSVPCATDTWGGLRDTPIPRQTISRNRAAKLLAKRIKYASRSRVLNEWIVNFREDHRVHGTVNPIGAWTHRCSHDKPNIGNIPRDDALFGREMRSFWSVPDGSYLVGVDAEGIQLRVLAHYIKDKRFTESLISGKKEDGTDPHSLNKLALGSPCRSRNDAKTFIYAWLLGAGTAKVAEILGCSFSEAKKAGLDFIEFYPGLKVVKTEIIPNDAARGYFEGFDGRYVKIFGDDEGSRRHFALAGYLQNGETLIMKRAAEIWYPKLQKEKVPFKLVNFVHDEWQTQVDADYDTAHYVATTQADAIREAGEIFGLDCPMAGSILSGHGGIAIGKNWYFTH